MKRAWTEAWADVVFEWRRVSPPGPFMSTLFARLRVLAGVLAMAVRLLAATVPSGEHPMRQLNRDVVYALRRLRRASGFSAFAVATLGLGIGAATATYSVVHAVVLRAPDLPDVDRVLKLFHSPPDQGGSIFTLAFSWPDFADLKAQQTSFTKVAAWSRFSHALVGPNGSHGVTGELVDGDYFAVLQVQPALGRLLQPADDDPAAAPVIVLGDALWRSMFAADPNVVGRGVVVSGHHFEVVGVAPASCRGVDAPSLFSTGAWVPIRQRFLLARAGYLQFRDQGDRENRWVRGIARLRPDRTLADAASELTLIGQRLDAAVPIGKALEYRSLSGTSRRWSAMRIGDVRIHESMGRIVGPVVTAVLVSVALVLLVVCTNLANLLLARGASRRQETAVRLALGASRFRLVREQVVESALLAVAGGVLGVVVARGLMVWLATDLSLGDGIPVTLSVRPELNLAVLLLSCGATLLALLSFGVLPAWHSTHSNVRDVLATDTTGGALPRWRGRRILIAVQVAVSVGLLAVTAVSTQRIVGLAVRDPGFALDRLALVEIDVSLTGFTESRARAVLDQALERARLAAGVEAVTLASRLPIGSGGGYVYTSTVDRPLTPEGGGGIAMSGIVATPTVFGAIGVSIQAGRGFDARDIAGAQPVVVLSAAAAEQLFNTREVVGKTVELKVQNSAGAAETPIVRAAVIGVAGNTDVRAFRDRELGVAYLPYAQHYEPRMNVIARAGGDPRLLVGALRAAVVQTDRQLTIVKEATGPSLAGEGAALLRVVAGVSGVLGGFALLLSLVGLYGVLSFLVARRAREIGVRIALGARPSQVRRMMLVDGLKPVIWGLVVGSVLMAPVILSSFTQRLLLSSNTSVIAALAAPVLLLAAAAAAAYWPARRASRTDPNVALRQL